MSQCLACDLARSEDLPGGCIYETEYWRVEHCIGPLGVGTLIVKPKRHVLHVADLVADEASELGIVLQRTAAVVTDLVEPDQVYVTLWSHAGGEPMHIHWVVQPVTRPQMEEFGTHGPRVQAEMFARGKLPHPAEVEAFASRARTVFANCDEKIRRVRRTCRN